MLFALCLALLAPPSATVREADPPRTVAEPIRKTLSTQSIEWHDGTAKRASFWLRTAIPGKASADQIKNGLTARECTESSLVGVVTLHEAWVDYRKQDIPAGTYTLRLAFQPDTGDHRETAPHTEFLLLCPVETDPTPDELEIKTVVERSRKATGGDHPAVMMMVPISKDVKEPTTEDLKPSGSMITLPLSVEIGSGTTILKIGLVVKGVSSKR